MNIAIIAHDAKKELMTQFCFVSSSVLVCSYICMAYKNKEMV